jgi:hypothetical protein
MVVGAALLAGLSAASCGSAVGDCSEGAPGCNSQPPVHWTPTRISAALNHFSYAPTVRGRLRNASCHIIGRFGGQFDVKAVCSATFTAPRRPPRRIRVMFLMSGNGAVNVWCPKTIANNPFCRWEKAHP